MLKRWDLLSYRAAIDAYQAQLPVHTTDVERTKLLSHLRQTTRECVFLVTWQRQRSHHSIRYSQELHAACKLHSSISIEPKLLPTEVLHCGNREFHVFSCCDLDLDPMTFIYELDPYPVKISPETKDANSTSRLSKVIVIQTYRHTDIQSHWKH